MTDDHHKFCWISYWKKNADGYLVSSSRDDWSEAVVGPISVYSGYGEQRFQRSDPHAEHKISALVALLRQAFEAGRRDKLREIKDVLR